MHLLNPPDWIRNDGQQFKFGASLAAGTYYAIIPLRGATAFGGTFYTDAACIATATVDGNDLPMTDARKYAATGTSGWTDESAIADVSITAGADTFALGHVLDFERSGARVKLVVATAGVCTFYPTIKGCD